MYTIWSLFITFLKVGFISFGGGYAMIPVIQQEVQSHRWLSDQEFTDAVSLAGMAPGPIATNSATLIGYKTAGIIGSIAATLGMILPSLILIILIAAYFYRINRHKWVRSSFYGLRPVVTGLIIYAAIHFGYPKGGQDIDWHIYASLLITAGVITAIIKYKMNVLAVILISALVGIALFS
nr:chromate transporter [Paenibacillus hamazuiensis]